MTWTARTKMTALSPGFTSVTWCSSTERYLKGGGVCNSAHAAPALR
jgi:hypothetical protein